MDCICTPYPLDFSLTRLRWWWWCPIWLWFNVESWNFRIPDSLLSIFCIQQWLWPRHKMNESMRYHFLFTYGSNPSWKEFWWEWEIDFCPMAKLAWAPMFYLPNQANQCIHPFFFLFAAIHFCTSNIWYYGPLWSQLTSCWISDLNFYGHFGYFYDLFTTHSNIKD